MKPVEEFIYRMTFNAKTMTVDVEQVGELIRCKDCKAFNGLNCVRNNMIAVRSYDYCSRAERKEE